MKKHLPKVLVSAVIIGLVLLFFSSFVTGI